MFAINYSLAIVYDEIDQKSLKYQILDNYDFMQFYLNKYHIYGFEKGLNFFWLFVYLVKVKKLIKFNKIIYLEFTPNFFNIDNISSRI